ncbi:MAG TPA: DHH family phosphoesterase, partial [Chloroflexota bacterium]|nr:DHH family phosphoesterase [Chloroflexota bacterium]
MQRAAAMASVPHPTGVRPWQVAPAAPAAFLALLPDIHPVAAQVLYNRGLTSAAEVRLFLDGGAAPLHDPRTLYSIERAIVRLRRAVRDGERVAVYGDFDVDGVTATAILLLGLRGAGAQVTPVVPQRTTTGYGLRPETVERLAAEGVRLIVTGDTGTRATEAVTRAAELGVDVIVTDHHLPGEELPPALAVVNPQQAACPYPFKELSGAGVAWKLVQALALEGCLPTAVPESLLDLVALGTIVDVAPLRGENRALVQRGLRRLEEAPRLGIRAMLGLLGQESRQGQGPPAGMSSRRRAIDERTVAFNIGPRLNAAGRMD